MKAFRILLTLSTFVALASGEYNFLEQGVTEKLTAKEIAEIKPWAENSQVFLQELLIQTRNLSKNQKISQLENGIQEIVLDSAPKRSELFLRYALNRGVYMSRVLVQEAGEEVLNVKITRVRILERSIDLALQFYQNDIRFLTAGEDPRLSRGEFALAWITLNQELARSIQDASAQYELYRFGLERLQVDLGKSTGREEYAVDVIRIEKQLQLQKMLNPKTLFDQQLLVQIRYIKQIMNDLNLLGTSDYSYGKAIKNHEERVKVFIEESWIKGPDYLPSNYLDYCDKWMKKSILKSASDKALLKCYEAKYQDCQVKNKHIRQEKNRCVAKVFVRGILSE